MSQAYIGLLNHVVNKLTSVNTSHESLKYLNNRVLLVEPPLRVFWVRLEKVVPDQEFPKGLEGHEPAQGGVHYHSRLSQLSRPSRSLG